VLRDALMVALALLSALVTCSPGCRRGTFPERPHGPHYSPARLGQDMELCMRPNSALARDLHPPHTPCKDGATTSHACPGSPTLEQHSDLMS